MEQYFLQFLNIYFWVFIVMYIIFILYIQTDEYSENKKNAIKNGNISINGLQSIIGWTLFVLSIILT